MSPTGEKHTLAPVYGTGTEIKNLLDVNIWKRFDDLDCSGKICAEVRFPKHQPPIYIIHLTIYPFPIAVCLDWRHWR